MAKSWQPISGGIKCEPAPPDRPACYKAHFARPLDFDSAAGGLIELTAKVNLIIQQHIDSHPDLTFQILADAETGEPDELCFAVVEVRQA
jgi:hypothetical protein